MPADGWRLARAYSEGCSVGRVLIPMCSVENITMSVSPCESPLDRLELASPASLCRTVVVADRDGLHLRTCLAVVAALRGHQAHVTIRTNGRVEDATSILGLISLAASPGTELVLSATGPTAEEALDAVAMVLTNNAA